MDIVDTAVSAGNFNTLVAAVKVADLVAARQVYGPCTVIATTDKAFAALPAGTVDNLLKPENKAKLSQILTYQVISGKVMSTDLSDGMTPVTVNRKLVTIHTKGGVKVNEAKVSTADIDAEDGVIHVINAVLLPKS
jgi:uncharacterized surface protein with fasciclin (FAS1) repeats